MIAAQMASHQNWSMVKGRSSHSQSHSRTWSMNALTTMRNSPSVTTMKGSDKSRAIGLTKALSTPKTSATRRIVTTFFSVEPPSSPRWTPSTTRAATQRATPLATTRIRKFLTAALWQVAVRGWCATHGRRDVVLGWWAERRGGAPEDGPTVVVMTDDLAPVRLRPAIAALPAYTPGRAAAAPAGLTAYKCSSNENPFAPLPSVLDVVWSAATEINRYPDMAVTGLTRALADRLDVPPERISTGPGSVGVLAQLSPRPAGRGTRSSSPGGRSRRTRSS